MASISIFDVPVSMTEPSARSTAVLHPQYTDLLAPLNGPLSPVPETYVAPPTSGAGPASDPAHLSVNEPNWAVAKHSAEPRRHAVGRVAPLTSHRYSPSVTPTWASVPTGLPGRCSCTNRRHSNNWRGYRAIRIP
jgi:hypothetical protein